MNFSIESEQSVIGAMLSSPAAWDRIADKISESDFYAPEHQLIFRHISRLAEQGKPVDVITVAESLQSTGKLDKIGGLQHLGELAASVPSASNIVIYAELVRKKRKERDFLAAIDDIQSIANEAGTIEEKIAKCIDSFTALADGGSNDAVRLSETLSKAIEGLEDRFASGGEIKGLKTGFNDFDKKLNGLQGGDLVIIAGRPAMGKTCFATNIAENVAVNNQTVLFFSLEMSDEQLTLRTLASQGSINLTKLRLGKIDDEDWTRLNHGVGKIHDAPFFIDQSPMITASQMHAKARRIKRQHGLSLIVIDYLQLMSEGGDNRNNELSTITRKLKLMAKDLNIPVICLSQLSRKVEERANKRPMLSDLRDSGAIEQDADIVVLMYRDDYYNKDSMNKGLAEAEVAKQRMGETGTVFLSFQGEYSRFKDFYGTINVAEKRRF